MLQSLQKDFENILKALSSQQKNIDSLLLNKSVDLKYFKKTDEIEGLNEHLEDREEDKPTPRKSIWGV